MAFTQNNRKTYIYDGSFEGLLTIVFDSYLSKTLPFHIFSEATYQMNILDTIEWIKTDYHKADRIFHGIVKHISYNTLYQNYYAFLAEDTRKEMAIVQYLLNGFVVGPKINTMLSLDYVFTVQSLRKRMLGESHRLKGLLRFQEVSNHLYYASIHPDNNVLENLGQHFIKRLPTQNFLIHDKKRELCFIYDTQQYKILSSIDLTIPPITEEEAYYQQLWKTFFKTIAIPERKNPRLQMQYMPKKYWQDLIEKP
ncbi:MAG: TIGR03915 family putative DNA repair protein [Clostridia bacterium]